eukprot:765541-Hanusia_phi.AAC.3
MWPLKVLQGLKDSADSETSRLGKVPFGQRSRRVSVRKKRSRRTNLSKFAHCGRVPGRSEIRYGHPARHGPGPAPGSDRPEGPELSS